MKTLFLWDSIITIVLLCQLTYAFQNLSIGRYRWTWDKTYCIQSRIVLSATSGENGASENNEGKRPKIRDKVKKFAKTIIVKPITTVAPKAIAEILTDATTGAVEVAWETLDELKKGGSIRSSTAFSQILEKEAEMQGDTAEALDAIAL